MGKSIIFFLSILVLFCNYSHTRAQGFTIGEDKNSIVIDTPDYRVQLYKSPLQFAVLKGEKKILAGKAPATSQNFAYFVRGGEKRYLTDVKSWSAGIDRVFLTVATTVTGVDAEITLSLHKNYIDFRWHTNDFIANNEMGYFFSLKTSGHWYGGNVTSAHNWPLESGDIRLDPFLSTSNQTAPVWFTSSGAGIFVKTYRIMGFSINGEHKGLFNLNIKNTNEFSCQILVGDNIVDAYYTFIDLVGKPKTVPPKAYFTDAIFNTWIEYGVNVDQKDVIDYAKKIRKYDFPCTVLDIDDKWQSEYGDYDFDPQKFPTPEKMADEIHDLGFKLALWVVPFIHKEAKNFKVAEENNFLVKDKSGENTAFIKWWNGTTAQVDLSNPAGYEWFLAQLVSLQQKYGVDGFKLDGGDAGFFHADFKTFGNITPNRYTDLFAGLGQHFAINELRVSWLTQPLGLVQRLRDKKKNWGAKKGIASLIPNGLTESLIGYAYFCPDMIGGGLDKDFRSSREMDPELFVRWTQASALMPMMQFSFAPWNLEEKYVDICRKYAYLHKKLGDYIYQLAQQASVDGTPIVRPLFFRNPEDENTYSIMDEFMLGDRFLVAPVLKKGAVKRDVYLPAGLWQDFWNGEIYQGKQVLADYPAPLEKLPIFTSIM